MTHVTIERATLEQVLEALEGNTTNPVIDPEQAALEDQAIIVIKQALAQPAQQGLADEVIGCFDAAKCEGLAEALANTTDEHLKDLVERRLMYAFYAAQESKEKSK